MSSRLLLIAAAALALGACSTMNKNIGEEDPGIGEIARYNAAIQTVNPDPVYAEDGAKPGDSGVRVPPRRSGIVPTRLSRWRSCRPPAAPAADRRARNADR